MAYLGQLGDYEIVDVGYRWRVLLIFGFSNYAARMVWAGCCSMFSANLALLSQVNLYCQLFIEAPLALQTFMIPMWIFDRAGTQCREGLLPSFGRFLFAMMILQMCFNWQFLICTSIGARFRNPIEKYRL